MDAIIASLVGNQSNTGQVSIGISFIALLSGIWFYFKKTNIEEVTQVGTLQHQQIEQLMSQVTLLSTELKKARDQLTEIHEQNLRLMHQIRDSNSRIQELEDLLSKKPPSP